MSRGKKILMMVKETADDSSISIVEKAPIIAKIHTNDNISINPDNEVFDILSSYLDNNGNELAVEINNQADDQVLLTDTEQVICPSKEVVDNKSNCENTCKKGTNDTTAHSDVDNRYEQVELDDLGDLNRKMSQAETRRGRVLGLPYMGYKRLNKQVFNGIPKPGRMIRGRCSHKTLTKNTSRSFRCAAFAEEDRTAAHNEFWKIETWKEKRAFIKGLVVTRNIRRRRKGLDEGGHKIRKNEGHDIYLQVKNGEKLRVCRNFFLNTLGLGEDTFKRWVKQVVCPDRYSEKQQTEQEEHATTENVSEQNSDNGQTTAVGSRKRVRDNAKLWLRQLPKVPSHYCRASSNKVYVESTFRSKLHMFTVYKDWCIVSNMKPAGKMLFTNILDEENISIHMPRKDQCDLCCGFEVGTVNQNEYDRHIKNKNDAREAKNAAKLNASPQKLVLTMDLQSVLLCPLLLASQVYYKQKLQVHNFTLYELSNGNVTLYVWHEGNGGVSSNEFTSCIVDFISGIPDKVKEVTLISDGCNYQNRNKILASGLSDLAKSKAITIEQLYLEKGHTMMEADSVHATLEKYFKPPINSPADYITLMRMARPSNPYNVKVLDYNFFRNFEESTDLPSIRPGKKPGDPQVVDIRALLYKPDGSILFKLHHTNEYSILPQRRNIHCKNRSKVAALYQNPVPINESKYKHLQEMKTIIEEPHRAFYDSLSFKPDRKK